MSKYIIPNNLSINEDCFDIYKKVQDLHKALTEIYAVMNDIRYDDGWVNDSHSQARYDGGVDAIEQIKERIHAISNEKKGETNG